MRLPDADEPHGVPTGYFNVVADGTGRVTTFFFDQDTPRGMDHCEAIVILEDVETASGLDLLPRKPDSPGGALDAKLGCQ